MGKKGQRSFGFWIDRGESTFLITESNSAEVTVTGNQVKSLEGTKGQLVSDVRGARKERSKQDDDTTNGAG